MFARFIVLLLRMGLLGLRRTDHIFTPEVKSAATSRSTFESLLYTIPSKAFYTPSEPRGSLSTKRENSHQTGELAMTL
jgi:hypothetical protein